MKNLYIIDDQAKTYLYIYVYLDLTVTITLRILLLFSMFKDRGWRVVNLDSILLIQMKFHKDYVLDIDELNIG